MTYQGAFGKRSQKPSGFTLIELILSITILGILVVIGTIGLVNVIDGYRFSAENAELSQKAEATLMRMAAEFPFIIASGVQNSSSATRIDYRADFGSGNENHTIIQSGSQIQLDNRTLTDLVDGGGFQVLYLAADGTTQVQPGLSRIIQVALTLRGNNNVAKTFTPRLALRN
jgi:prepilin-type N-terminal cleavage/methylation domain-containing protein